MIGIEHYIVVSAILFVLGVLVSIVKAHLYFEISPDPGIFAYAALAILITIFAGVDLRQLWETLPEHATTESPE